MTKKHNKNSYGNKVQMTNLSPSFFKKYQPQNLTYALGLSALLLSTAALPAFANPDTPTQTQANASAPVLIAKPTLTTTAQPLNPRTALPLTRNLDWVQKPLLSDEQKKTLGPGCCGAYVAPIPTHTSANRDPKTVPLRASARKIEAQGTTAIMKGSVELTQGYRQMRSDALAFDKENQHLTLTGNVQFREPGLLVLGDKVTVDLRSEEFSVDTATWLLHEAALRGTAKTFARKGEQLVIEDASYTTCEPGNNTWSLNAKEMAINSDTGMATARHMHIDIKEVPVLYLPWIRYPADGRRASGLLFPQLGFSQENGLSYAQPIYLNLAPNYDATLTPRHLQERGQMLELEFRHLSELSQTTLATAWLGDDKGGDDGDEDIYINPLTQKRLHEGDDRWLASINHLGGFDQRWNTEIDYTKTSDVDYFQDIGNGSLQTSSQTHLRQHLSLGYNTAHWQLNIQRNEYQTLVDNIDNQYQELPRIEARGRYRTQIAGQDLVFNLKNRYTVFDHDDDARVTGKRFNAEYALSLNKQWLWGYFRPTIKLKHISYDLNKPVTPGGDDQPSETVPVSIIDTGLFFERNSTLFGGYTQTLEPRLYYLNAKYKDQSSNPNFDTSNLTFSYQQLFRDDRFSGGDRIGDTEQLTASLTSRAISASTGIERMYASVGQIFYLRDRRVALDSAIPNTVLLRSDSDFAAELAVYFNKDWRMQSDVLYNYDSNQVNKGSVSLRFKNDQNAIFNATYRYTREDTRFIAGRQFNADIEQTDFSTYFPINNRWNLIARWNYDLTNNRELETFGGIEYSSCCWRAAMVFRRWLDRDDKLQIPEEDLKYDNGIFFQIQLRGLAGTGKNFDRILGDGIYGYEAK